MMKKITYLLIVAIAMVSSLAYAEFPKYYPEDGFQDTGMLDDVQLDRQMLVINGGVCIERKGRGLAPKTGHSAVEH